MRVSSKKRWLLILIPLMLVSLTVCPATSSAQAVAVPIWKTLDTSFTTTMQYSKSFILDRLATAIAKQILHQMTVSVVNWINHGFNGSPSFLTNPNAFFENVGDQVTGEWIAGNGVLSGLCGNIGANIRSTLALQQSNGLNQRYTCTLSTIINNFQNLPNNINVNGMSINGFMNGDFSQGGWPAFIALTTEPQNNPYGAYLSAQSDLQYNIAVKQGKVQADVNLGHGFMSWQSCTDIPGGTFSTSAGQSNNNSQVASVSNTSLPSSSGSFANYQAQQQVGPTVIAAQNNTPANQIANLQQAYPDAKAVFNSNGTVTYQNCTTQTPGSVIAGQLNQQLGVPANELLLANSINSVINALVTQMVSTMLHGGLNSLSSSGGYTSQLSANNSKAVVVPTATNFADTLTALQNNIDTYSQAITDVQGAEGEYESARACFSGLLSSTTTPLTSLQQDAANYDIASIDTAVATNVDPLLQTLAQDETAAQNDLAQAQALFATTTADFSPLNTDANGDTTATSTQALLDQESQFIQSVQGINQASSNAAASTAGNQPSQELKNAETQATAFTKDASKYEAVCRQLPTTGL